MEALLVVDIQPETVKPRRAETYLTVWNEVIESFDREQIAYIANLRPFARTPDSNPFQEGLLVVSDNVFFKRAPNSFTNQALTRWLRSIGAEEVSIIGIDGNWCIKATALGALKQGIKSRVLVNAVSSKNDGGFRRRTMPKLLMRGVALEEWKRR